MNKPSDPIGQIYDTAGHRLRDSGPQGTSKFCSTCKVYNGHKTNCSEITKEQLAHHLEHARGREKWAIGRVGILRDAITAMHGKFAMLRHENNKLRKVNEKLRSEQQDIARLRRWLEFHAELSAKVGHLGKFESFKKVQVKLDELFGAEEG